MLRNIVLTLGGTLIATAAVAGLAGSYPFAIFCLAWGVILTFGILYERYAYKSIVDKAPTGKGWSRTDERFVDPASGRTVTVYVQSFTGERAYVAELQPASPPVVEG
jgi:hypothetical protein